MPPLMISLTSSMGPTPSALALFPEDFLIRVKGTLQRGRHSTFPALGP